MNWVSRPCVWIASGVIAAVTANAFAYVPGKFYYQGHTKDKVIALTFDDGPGVITPQVLDFLKQHQIRATFFMEGDQVPLHPEYVKAVLAAGHEIGNHTMVHPNFHKVEGDKAGRLSRELDETEAALQKALGDPNFHTHIVRMPYGYYNRTWLMPLLKEKGYALVHWTFGTDWLLKKTPEQMSAEYIKNAHPGAVFLMHDGGRHREKTWAVLQAVVPALEQKGYHFVACEDLFKDPPVESKK